MRETTANPNMSRPRRVLILVENLPSPFDRRVWQEACSLRDAGYLVSIICPTGRGYERKFEAIDGIHIYRYKLPVEASGAAGYALEYAIALAWTLAMQSSNGGWAAFDANNLEYYLNNIPFSDHGALLDPPTEDVTARCVSMLAQLGETAATSKPLADGVAYLRRTQLAEGSWYGRWGLNYIYGTWSVLCALNAAGIDHQDPMMRRAVDWLISVQNKDGGWGENAVSYRLDYKGYEHAPSTSSQTAWALLGLMAAGEVENPAILRGVQYLKGTQTEKGLWDEARYTATGFPRVFYLRYHGYSKFFPLWALARYRNLRSTNSRVVGVGM